jgi:CubicO group peptidase (beta-lactamase class C family)
MRGALEELDQQLLALAANDELSGVVLLAREGRRLFQGAYGWANRAWRIPMGIDMRFDCASITKLFTAVATLQRVEAGDFDLDTSAIEDLGLEGTAISTTVTVHHLLSHTSGIADDADEEAGERYEDLFVDKPNYSEIEAADHLPDFVHKPPNFPPGEGSRYCNGGFILLGLMVEKATGTSYRDYVRREVFALAGMSRSGFFRMDEITPDIAEPCEPLRDGAGAITGWKRNIYSYPPIGTPDGGAHVTAGDLVRFVDSARADKLLSTSSTEFMFTRHAHWFRRDDGTGADFGYAVQFDIDAGGGVESFGKDGVNVGVSGEVLHFPESGLTMAVLTTAENAAWEPIKRIKALVRSGALDNQ